ncbi:Uncharacterised protein [Legionella pneumophila]|nr:Uncharacterised protein [Legionella pneumophila]CZG96196.1 Uncharacterised protein [Legionella pneumophila]CZL61599.1 Uncharacterised protein [Legionella pneumophila]CZL78065.1 Uncharacterised protein [Legionella pneumophila]CZL98697.1 Uncharacterised protein [Legionella pneumophila]
MRFLTEILTYVICWGVLTQNENYEYYKVKD